MSRPAGKCPSIQNRESWIWHIESWLFSYCSWGPQGKNSEVVCHSLLQIMASSPITSRQIDGETMETVTDFIFQGSKITADGDCSHEIKRHLLLGRKTMTNLDSILKSRDITLLTKVHLDKAVVFPVVTYGCESWTMKKAECQRINAFELWCWRRLLRVPWTVRRSNQSILKDQYSSLTQSFLTLCDCSSPPCPSSTPGVYSNSRPLSQWCHPAISSSVDFFSSSPQSFPASESFPMSQLFTWGGQSTGVAALASVLPKNTQGWSPLEWTG